MLREITPGTNAGRDLFRMGVLAQAQRRGRLESGFHQALRGFDERILAFTTVAALRYGPLVGERTGAGRPTSIADAQIAAIVTQVQAALATTNTEGVLAPWRDDGAR